jgi:hypothetical protein
MIDHLRAARGAHFFARTSRITKKAVLTLFADLLAEASNPSRPVFKVEHEQLDGARFSALCFAYDRPVSFLAETSGKVDRIHGFLLLVEKGTTVALLKTGLDVTAAFKKAHLAPLGRKRVERAIARHDAVFEKLSLRNMTTSKLALRAKTLEARDLENAIAASSAGRFIPQGYRVRRDDGSYSATPSTGRIALRSDRADLDAAVAWVSEIVDLLDDEVASSSTFITRFARPVELDQIDDGTVPTFFAVDTMALAEALWEAEEKVRLVREEDGVWQELDRAQIEAILADLDQPFTIASVDGDADHQLQGETGAVTGSIRFNKARIALRRLDRPSLSGIFVEDAVLGVGQDLERQQLVRHLDAEDMFTVLFSDLALAYIDGSLFRDEALVGGGDAFMRHLQAEPALAAATSEKGDFVEGQTQFAHGSVFRVVVDRVAREDVLLCDDLGDEWADFIGVGSAARPPTISFYHAKHGQLSMGASAFHDAVGQAIKNLGRLSLSGDMMAAKHVGWDSYYKNDNVSTAIAKRIRGGTRAEVESKMADAAAAPDVQRRVLIVTSSLSRAEVQAAFDAAAIGSAPKPSFVQLYWLLTGFFSACTEIGAVGFVVCRP